MHQPIPCAGKMAAASHRRLLQLLCSADGEPRDRSVPPPRLRTLAACAAAAWTEGSHGVGTDHPTRGRLASSTAHHPSLA